MRGWGGYGTPGEGFRGTIGRTGAGRLGADGQQDGRRADIRRKGRVKGQEEGSRQKEGREGGRKQTAVKSRHTEKRKKSSLKKIAELSQLVRRFWKTLLKRKLLKFKSSFQRKKGGNAAVSNVNHKSVSGKDMKTVVL